MAKSVNLVRPQTNANRRYTQSNL